MGNVLFYWILLGILSKQAQSVGNYEDQSGSKNCNMTLRFNPRPLLFSKYHSLEVLKHHDKHSDYSMLDCRVLSIRLIKDLGKGFKLRRDILDRMLTKKHNTRLQLILLHWDLKHLLLDKIIVHIELDCNGRRCSLRSAESIKKKTYIQSSWGVHQTRQLLSFKTLEEAHSRNLPLVPILVSVAVVITLIVVLAMCACANTTREKALSNEVGGTEVDHHVVGVNVSKVIVEEAQNTSQHEKSGTNDNQTTSNDRRNTSESKKSEVTVQSNSQSVAENGDVKTTGRTASHSSQSDKRSIGDGEPRFTHTSGSFGSRDSVNKIEDVALGTSAPAKGPESTGLSEKERKRSGSEKEAPSTKKDNKESSSFNESRTGTDSSEGAKKSASRFPSRKRQGSDGKEPKSSPDEHEEHKAKFWQRRKSSKTKFNIDNAENPSPKKEKKKKKSDQASKVPEIVQPTTRPTNLPLPPRPNSFVDEETHYEVVESRTRPKDKADDYETVTTSKTKKYDKVNIKTNNEVRPSSELYECINDEDSKMKRISSGSHQYDVVETKIPPKKTAASLEYAYAVVSSRDKPMIPTESSGNSDLYEVVTDELKQQSGAATRTSDPVVEDDYATVQKDPSKKLSSDTSDDNRSIQPDKQERSLPGERQPAPAPPPVSSLIHVATSSSVRRRPHSEGDELSVEHSNSPTEPNTPDRPQTMFEIEEMYAKVNMAMKKRHSAESPSHQFAPADSVPEGFYEEGSETPPPVPPSLYAELESLRNNQDQEHGNENHTSEISSSSPQKADDNAYEEVSTKVEIKSITSRPVVSNLKISKSKENISNDRVSSKSPKDPNGVLKRLKRPQGSPRTSDGSRLSGHSLEGDKRLSAGSQHDYDEVLTKDTQTDRSSRSSKEINLTVPTGNGSDSGSGYYESIENESKRDSTAQDGDHLYDVVVEGKEVTTKVVTTKVVTTKELTTNVTYYV